MENTQCVIHKHISACFDVRAVTLPRELEKSAHFAYFYSIIQYGMW